MSKVQAFAFAQSLVLKARYPDCELTRTAAAFRSEYKRLRGLPQNAKVLRVLKDFMEFCDKNGLGQTFHDATWRYPGIIEAAEKS